MRTIARHLPRLRRCIFQLNQLVRVAIRFVGSGRIVKTFGDYVVIGLTSGLLALNPLFAQERRVEFDEEAYSGSIGEPIELNIQFNAPIPNGLFSYGVRLEFDPASGRTDTVFEAVDPLNFNGVLGEGALQDSGEDWVGIKGTVDIFQDPVNFYDDILVTTVHVTYDIPGDYNISLGIFNTLGPTEEIFVDGEGTVLDDNLSFGSARVTVIPEPTTWGLLLIGLLGLIRSIRQRCRLEQS